MKSSSVKGVAPACPMKTGGENESWCTSRLTHMWLIYVWLSSWNLTSYWLLLKNSSVRSRKKTQLFCTESELLMFSTRVYKWNWQEGQLWKNSFSTSDQQLLLTKHRQAEGLKIEVKPVINSTDITMVVLSWALLESPSISCSARSRGE